MTGTAVLATNYDDEGSLGASKRLVCVLKTMSLV